MDPIRFYLAARGFYGLCWTTMVTVTLIFMVQVAGLDPLQMVLVGTALEVSAFVFEIPTGILADAYSRKWSVVLGHLLTGLAFIEMALFPTFAGILVAQVIWGFGWTFISGAFTAWLSDEAGVERANRALLRGTRIAQVTSFVGIGLSVALAHQSLHLPILAGGLGIVALSVAMIVWMREDHFTPARVENRQTLHALTDTFMGGVRQLRMHPVLVTIMLVAVVFGMFSEGFDRLYVPHLVSAHEFPQIGQLDNVVWWGVIAAVGTLVGIVATTLGERFVDTNNHRQLTWTLGGLVVAIGLAVVVFANAQTLMVALVFYWLANGLRQVHSPLETAWLNRRLSSDSRATMLSMQGQADALGQAFGGPVVGVIAKTIAIPIALTISGLLLLPSIWLYRRAAKADD